jgi:protease IV
MVQRMVMICGVLWLAAGCSPMTLTLGGAPRDNELRAKVVERAERPTRDRVAIVDVSGMIFNAQRPGLFGAGENPVALLHERLEAARRDPQIRAVILRINSPGGTVTASDAMYREVRRFRQRSGKPVVALLMDVAASGGYYVACGADRIVAYPTSVTGSIGVLVQAISLQPALGRLGITAEAITTGPNKTAGSLFSQLQPEQRAVLQAMVDDFYERFVAVVRQARPGVDLDADAHLLDGRIMSGQQAHTSGLVDAVGDLTDAAAEARRLAGVEHADLVIYHRPLSHVGSPYAMGHAAAGGGGVGGGVAAGGTQVNIASLVVSDGMADASMQFYYLWTPPLR